MFSCNDTKKSNDEEQSKQVVEEIESKKEEPRFEEIENLLMRPGIVRLSDTPFTFSEDIVFEEVNILKEKDDTYTLIYVIDPFETDFDKLQDWKIGVWFFAENPEEFEDESIRKKRYKSFGTKIEPNTIDNEIVVLYKNITLAPKKFKTVRTYLYNNDGEILGNKKYINSNVILP